MRNVILFGASGNLGRAVAAELVARQYKVTAVCRSQRSSETLAGLPVRIILVNPLDKPALKGICSGQEVVISTLGKSVSPFERSSETFEQVDLIGNSNILIDAMSNRVAKFVYVSAFHSEKYLHLDYFRVHHEFSQLLVKSGIDYSIVKPPAIFSALFEVVAMARRGQLASLGPGDKRTNPISERDLARICVDAIDQPRAIIEVGGKHIYTRKQLLETVRTEVAPNASIREIPVLFINLMLPLLKVTSKNTYDKLAFFLQVMKDDVIAPQVGEESFEDYLRRRKND